MLTLYSYPPLFGVADNNGYGLKVYAFLKLARVPFKHEHIFDASKAPRGQLPYIVDGNDTVGDSGTIIDYLTDKYSLTIDAALTQAQRTQSAGAVAWRHPSTRRPKRGRTRRRHERTPIKRHSNPLQTTFELRELAWKRREWNPPG